MTVALWCVLIAFLLPYLCIGIAKAGGKVDMIIVDQPGLKTAAGVGVGSFCGACAGTATEWRLSPSGHSEQPANERTAIKTTACEKPLVILKY